jgi:ribose transport system ATP-binding protein
VDGKEILSLDMRGVSKQFPGTLAVDSVDFQVRPGEVHALLGENGAGKSTLMKMIAGSFSDYTGDIYIMGEKVELNSPAAAKAKGVGMVYQELSLAMPLTIAENVLAGRIPTKGKIFADKKAMKDQTIECLKRVGLGHLDPFACIKEISQQEAQLVEIAKTLGNNPSILVMDEPTSSLSREEVKLLFGIIDNLKKQGLAIIYISHHLPELFEVADRITIMRDGKKIGTYNIDEVTTKSLVEMMVGRPVDDTAVEVQNKVFGEEKLRVEHLTRHGFFHDISFNVRANEVLGIGGLSGAGRSELARGIVGADAINSGKIYIKGKETKIRSMSEALANGIAYLTENRKTQGLALRISIGENILSPLLKKHTKNGIYSAKRGESDVLAVMKELQVYPPDPTVTVGNLSGGNQQKVLLGKWVATKPQVLILDEPTRGVDVGAKMVIHDTIRRLAGEGNAVIVISSDLPELVALSDRVKIMKEGKFIGELIKGDLSEESVLLAANGEGDKLSGNIYAS